MGTGKVMDGRAGAERWMRVSIVQGPASRSFVALLWPGACASWRRLVGALCSTGVAVQAWQRMPMTLGPSLGTRQDSRDARLDR